MATTKVQAEHIAINAISGTIIADNAVTSVHIAQNAILTQHIDDGQVGTSQLAADAVTGAKLADSSVVTANIQDDQVTGDKLTDNIQIAGTLGVTGVLSPTTHVDMPDNAKVLLGTGDDLEIYHSGNNSYIKDAGTGNLILLTNSLNVNNAADTENMITATENGAVTLFYDNAAKLATNSGGVTVTGTAILGGATFVDNATAYFGTGLDLRIYHDANNSYISDTGTGNLIIKSSTAEVHGTDGGKLAGFYSEGRAALYYNNAEKLRTVSGGVDVTGYLASDALASPDGTQIVYLTNSAMVGINHASNTWGRLNVHENSATVASLVLSQGSGSGNALEINDGNTDGGGSLFKVSGAGLTKIQMGQNNHTSGLTMYNGASGGYGAGLSFSSYTSTSGATGEVTAARIRTEGAAAWNSAANNTANLVFSTINENTLSDKMWIRGNGMVGIGKSPSTDLHLYSTEDDRPHLLLEGYKNHGTNDAPIIELYTNDETTGGIADDTSVGIIRFSGDEKDGGTKEVYAEIKAIAHDPGSGSSNKGKLQFRTQSAGDISGTMTIDESSVGINNDDPAVALHVKQSGSAMIRVDCGGGTSDSGFEIYQNGTRKWEIVNDDSESDPLDIRTSGGAGGSGLRIAQTGNVGIQIGNNVPASPLHVLAGSTGSNPYVATAITMAPSNFPARTWQLRMDDGGAAGYGFSIAAADNRILYLNNNNRVGINEVSPDATFHVTGADGIRNERAGAGVYDMSIDNTVTGDAADLNFIAQTNDTGYHFRTRKSDGNLRSAFSISANGHIGIGHADPESGMDSSSYTQIKLGCGQIGDSGDSSGGNTYIANNLYSGASNDMKFRYAVPASMIGLTGGDIRVTTHDGGGASADATATMVTRFFIKETGLIAVGGHTPVGMFDIRAVGGASITPTTTTPLLFTASNSGSTCHHEFKVDHNSGVEIQRFINSNGQQGHIKLNSSATAFSTSSDYRLKENVEYTWDATTRLKQLKPARFNWIADNTNTLEDGFLAHEVSNVVPNAISGEKDAVMPDDSIDPQAIDQSKLIPLLVKTIQELEARIKTLEG